MSYTRNIIGMSYQKYCIGIGYNFACWKKLQQKHIGNSYKLGFFILLERVIIIVPFTGNGYNIFTGNSYKNLDRKGLYS